jgi:hypothetical protein
MAEGYFCKIQEARKTHPRAYLHWKSEEDKQLKALFLTGATLDKLSKVHKRQPKAIAGRLEQLGLIK